MTEDSQIHHRTFIDEYLVLVLSFRKDLILFPADLAGVLGTELVQRAILCEGYISETGEHIEYIGDTVTFLS